MPNPASPCLKIPTICSSVNLLFFTVRLPCGCAALLPGNSSLDWLSLRGQRQFDYNFTNRTEPVQSIIASPLLYFTNRTVLKGAWLTALLRYGGHDPEIGKPRDRQTLWAEELQAHSNWSQRYMAPARCRARFQEISKYSLEHGIDLRFIIFPGQTQLQAIPHRYGLDAEYAAFKRDLAEFNRVYDYDVPSALTADEVNYADPVHFRAPVQQMIIQDIWGSHKTLK